MTERRGRQERHRVPVGEEQKSGGCIGEDVLDGTLNQLRIHTVLRKVCFEGINENKTESGGSLDESKQSSTPLRSHACSVAFGVISV